MEKLKKLFEKDNFAKLCGIEIDDARPGYAKCSMIVTENHLNGLGTLMGGATFTLADFAFGVAANSHGFVAVSLNAYTSFLKPCTKGRITAVATEVSRTKRTGVYNVRIHDEENLLIAEVSGTCYFKKMEH